MSNTFRVETLIKIFHFVSNFSEYLRILILFPKTQLIIDLVHTNQGKTFKSHAGQPLYEICHKFIIEWKNSDF